MLPWPMLIFYWWPESRVILSSDGLIWVELCRASSALIITVVAKTVEGKSDSSEISFSSSLISFLSSRCIFLSRKLKSVLLEAKLRIFSKTSWGFGCWLFMLVFWTEEERLKHSSAPEVHGYWGSCYSSGLALKLHIAYFGNLLWVDSGLATVNFTLARPSALE